MPTTKALYANNAETYLAEDIEAGDLELTVAAGTGDVFPLPDPENYPAEYFVVALENVRGDYELLKVTARVDDVLTILRGWENTRPQAFTADSPTRVEHRLTAGAIVQLQFFGALDEAPKDGKPYDRKDANWAEDLRPVGEAPADGRRYGRRDQGWEDIDAQGEEFLRPVVPPTVAGQLVAYRNTVGNQAASPQDELVHTGTKLRLGEWRMGSSNQVLTLESFAIAPEVP